MDKEQGVASGARCGMPVTPGTEVKMPPFGTRTGWHLISSLKGKDGIFIRDPDSKEREISVTMGEILQL